MTKSEPAVVVVHTGKWPGTLKTALEELKRRLGEIFPRQVYPMLPVKIEPQEGQLIKLTFHEEAQGLLDTVVADLHDGGFELAS
jgi:hypothetical protein